MHWLVAKIRAHFPFVLSAALFVLLLSICLLLIYFKSASQLITSQATQTQSLACQGMANWENELFGVLERMKILEGDATLEQLIRLSDSSSIERTAPLYMLKKRLSALFTTYGQQTLSDVMIVFDAPTPYAVSTAAILEDLPQCIALNAFRCGTLDAEGFMAFLRQQNAARLLSRPLAPATRMQVGAGSASDCFLYIYNPLQLSQRCKVYVVVMFNRASITSQLSPEGWPVSLGTGWMFSEPIEESGVMQASRIVRGQSVSYIQGVSRCFGLTYTLRLDDHSVLARVNGFKTVILVLVMLSLTLVILMSVLFLWASVHPMNVVRSTLSAQSESDSSPLSYQAIAEQIRLLATQNRRNTEQLRSYESMHICAILNRLFSASALSKDEEETLSAFLSPPPGYSFRLVLLSRPQEAASPAEEEAHLAHWQALLSARLGTPALLCLKKKRYCVFLCAFPADVSEADLHLALSEDDLAWAACDTLFLFVSASIQGLSDLMPSFQGIRKRFHEINQRTALQSIYAPETLLPYREIARLHYLLLAGEGREACETLRLALERASATPDPAGALSYILADVGHLCERALITAGQEQLCDVVRERCSALSRQPDADALLDLLRSTAAACAKESLPNPEDPLVASICEFVDTQYADPLLSLSLLSERFHMSEKYFSAFFKNKKGINFSVYLEGVRMRHAQEELAAGELSVAQIAQAVGYANPNTFYKAFKRYTGVTPSQWKSQQHAAE